MAFRYHTEPSRGALILAAICVVAALLVPVTLLRAIILSIGAGPGAWGLLQWLRGRHAVRLEDGAIIVQNSLTGRTRRIPYTTIRGCITTRRGGLLIAYQEARATPPRPDPGQLALTQIRPESYQIGPKQRLCATAPLDAVAQLAAALSERVAQAGSGVEPLAPDFIRTWQRRRQVRDAMLFLLLMLATPVYIAVIGRIVSSFIFEVTTSGR